jgi:uncharacterized OsmC-like protein
MLLCLFVDVTAYWKGGYRCVLSARQFEVHVDEPPSSGGGDTGIQPTELLLGSLASCFALAIAHVAMKQRVPLKDLRVTATGEYDGPRFGRIVVSVDSSHRPDELNALVRKATTVCYVSNTLRGGPEIEYRVGDRPIHMQPAEQGSEDAPPRG